MAVVTIDRTLGSWGDRVASALSDELGFTLVDRDLLESLIRKQGLQSLGFGTIDEEMDENYLGGGAIDATIDLHIDLTTMKQSLVTKKNRKVRLIREVYPDINIKIFYEKDYHRLFEKYEAAKEETEVEDERPENGSAAAGGE